MAELHQQYDFVLMEAAAMNEYSDTQELVPFADKVLAVFNAHSVLKTADKASIHYLRGLNSKFAGSILSET